MPTWWCRICGKQIAEADVLVGRGGKQYHSTCLDQYFPEHTVDSSDARGHVGPRGRSRTLLMAALGFLVGCIVGLVARPTGVFAISGGLLGSVIGGLLGQHKQ